MTNLKYKIITDKITLDGDYDQEFDGHTYERPPTMKTYQKESRVLKFMGQRHISIKTYFILSQAYPSTLNQTQRNASL